MAEVTGPISSLPGRGHDFPDGTVCDQHPDRPAVARIQGETDSFGCEMNDMCEQCLAEHRAYLKSDQFKEDSTGACDWCGKHAEVLRNARDYDEGLCGPVYQVCKPCLKRRDDEAEIELAATDSNYFGDWYEDIEDRLPRRINLVSPKLDARAQTRPTAGPHFRVHFGDGKHLDVSAENPASARFIAKQKRPSAIITKIKVVKETAHG